MRYIINQIDYEIRPKKAGHWTREELKEAIDQLTDVNPIEIGSFTVEKHAYKFFNDLPNPYPREESTNLGSVIIGHYFTLDEVEDDEYINSEMRY